MRILADVHISPSTVQRLNDLGHDAVRSNAILPDNASDPEIVARAKSDGRAVLTQDLDFSDIVALSGETQPLLITLQLSDATVQNVNRILEFVLLHLESSVASGIAATVEDNRVRIRRLPVR